MMASAEQSGPEWVSALGFRPQGLTLLNRSSRARADVEGFIAHTYARHYGAVVRHFLPNLLCLHGLDGGISGALGFRHALGASLFLEHYLDIPVEGALSAHLRRPCDRHGVVEVGSLAAGSAGGTRALITALTGYLKGAGHDWAVFTAVASLRNSFQRLGIELLTLGAAHREDLPADEQANWGDYYKASPMVVAANVHQSYLALSARATQPGSAVDIEQILSLGRVNGWDASWAWVA